MNLTIAVLGLLFLILATATAWVMARKYSARLSRIDEELRALTVTLSELPKEASLKEYMFAQDQRLHAISEKLDTHADTDLLRQYIQDQANQLIAVISTHDGSRKPGITKSDLEISLRETHGLLERVLWSLRFDEGKYAESTAANRDTPEERGSRNISSIATQRAQNPEDRDDNISIASILNNNNDSYGAMLEYMQQSGKSGSEALNALETARRMHSR